MTIKVAVLYGHIPPILSVRSGINTLVLPVDPRHRQLHLKFARENDANAPSLAHAFHSQGNGPNALTIGEDIAVKPNHAAKLPDKNPRNTSRCKMQLRPLIEGGRAISPRRR